MAAYVAITKTRPRHLRGSLPQVRVKPGVKPGTTVRGHMRHVLSIVFVIVVALPTIRIGAVTRATSADGQFWDIQDTSAWAQDSGGIATGGRAYPFDGFGYLKLQVRRPDNALLIRNQYLAGFGLAADGAGRFDSITPILRSDRRSRTGVCRRARRRRRFPSSRKRLSRFKTP
jgi:hypothetical protein